MINVTIINLKSVSRYLIGVVILICIYCGIKFISEKVRIKTINISLVECLSDTLPKISNDTNAQKLREIAKDSRSSNLKRMLSTELPMIDNLIIDGEEDEEIHIATESSINDKNIEEAKTNVTTQEIQENNITPKYNGVFGSVKVKNESDKEITEETLTPNISLENNKDIIIFHTHTCESYTSSEQFCYEMTGSYRTTDLNYSVARVGDELEKHLKNYGYNVIHDKTYHDYPAYSGSYGRSLTTVKNILESNSNTQMVIDLHRDAVRK